MSGIFSKLLGRVWVAMVLFCLPSTNLASGLVAAWGENTYGETTLPVGINNIKAITAGYYHSLAIRSDGTVVGWGVNNSGQINIPPGLSNVVAVAVDYYSSLALKADGTLIAWGNDEYPPNGLSNVTAIAAGDFHYLALKTDGTVTAWGYDDYDDTDVPSGLSNIIAVAAGGEHSLALKANGTVVAWGYNGDGETNVPVDLSNVVAIAAGGAHNLALKADGTVVAWGYNSSGQTDVPSGLSNVVAIAAGDAHSLALKADGTIIAWGGSFYGEANVPAGLSNATAIAAGVYYSLALVFNGPIQIAQNPQTQQVSYASNVTFSVTASGAMPASYQWFFNSSAISNNSNISGATNSVLNISGAQFTNTGAYTVIVSNALGSVESDAAILVVTSAPIVISMSTNQSVLAGADVTLSVGAIGSPPLNYQWLFDGNPIGGKTTSLLSLTNLQSGQSGIYSLIISNAYGVVTNSISVSVADSAPYILTEPTNCTAMYGGAATFSVAARGTDPLSYQWRWNGQDISDATNASMTLTSLLPKNSGFYSVIVSNRVGQIASTKAYLSVAQIAVWSSLPLPAGLTNVPTGLTNVIAIAAGQNYLMALKADGTVASWGGILTNSIVVPPIQPAPFVTPISSPPTNVPTGLSNVVAIAAGNLHSLALKSNGTVVAWGDNTYGQTNVPVGLSNVVAIAAGATHSLALRSDGSIVEWGQINLSPVLLTNYPPPVLSNVTAIAAGTAQDMALKNDGTIAYWGTSTNFPPSLTNVIAISFAKNQITENIIIPSFNLDDFFLLRAGGTVVSGFGRSGVLPPSTTSGLSNIVAISGSLNLISDGSVVFPSLPSPPSLNFSNVIAIAAGVDSPGSVVQPSPIFPIYTSANFYAAVIGDGSPYITIQPANQSASKGSQIQFHARAVGVQPLKYQWQFNGEDISGATNADMLITNVTVDNVGNYQFLAANSLGSATSKVAQLTIPFSTNLAAALNATNLSWETFMSTNKAPSWFAEDQITHDGDEAAQSGPISDNQSSYLITTVTGPGTLTFWWKVSSEEDYDFLNFYLDDATDPLLRISGEVDWQYQTIVIPPGTHVARWIYSKDESFSAGEDAGWLDQVAFIPDAPLMLSTPRRMSDGSFAFAAGATNGVLQLSNLSDFEVQASTDLVNWITLTNALIWTNGGLEAHDIFGTNYPARFYRVIEH